VIFDYFYSQTLQEQKMRKTRWITRLLGEPLIFGIDEGQIVPFLTQRGFTDVHNADAAELQRLYLTGPNAGRPISQGVAIASARVVWNRP
jgi:O-methyltransferase involved in polyketide biosynthesis